MTPCYTLYVSDRGSGVRSVGDPAMTMPPLDRLPFRRFKVVNGRFLAYTILRFRRGRVGVFQYRKDPDLYDIDCWVEEGHWVEVGALEEHWVEVDALTAQSILYHLQDTLGGYEP